MIQNNNSFNIEKMNIPKVIIRNLLRNYFDFETIKKVLLISKKFNVLEEDDKIFFSHIKEGFIYCCNHGYLKEAKWYYYLHNVDINIKNKKIFIHTFYANHLETVKWIYNLKEFNINNLDEKWKNDMFLFHCSYGNLESAQWIYNLGVDINVCGKKSFIKACRYEHLEIAKWLHSLGTINIRSGNDCAFRHACVEGNTDIIKWLYYVIGDPKIFSDEFLDRGHILMQCCRDGNLSLAKWLYKLGEIDIHQDDDIFFLTACTCQKLNIAKWIHNIEGINKNKMRKIFIITYNRKYVEISKWLFKLCCVGNETYKNKYYELLFNNDKKYTGSFRWLYIV